MFGSQILEVAVGLVFVYLLVSIICSAVREGVETWLKTRAAYLELGIREMLHDRSGRGIARSLYEHPLIQGLYPGEYKPGKNWRKPPKFARGRNLPTYIPSDNVALALMDIAARGANPALASDGSAPVLSLENVRAGVERIGKESVQRVLLAAVDTAQGDMQKAQKTIENWYNSGMDRVSGWYKRTTQWILFWIGLFVAVALNVNTITIVDYLYRDDNARAAIVARAQAAARDSTFAQQSYGQARAALDSLGLPIGWSKGWGAPHRSGDLPSDSLARVKHDGNRNFFAKAASFAFDYSAWNGFWGPLFGWLMTALAATFGAPFWFDLLNKMMVIRSTVKPNEKSQPEGSEDRKPTVAAKTTTEEKVSVAVSTEPTTAVTSAAVHEPATGPPLVDGCDVPIYSVTPDEDLPPAEGGVA